MPSIPARVRRAAATALSALIVVVAVPAPAEERRVQLGVEIVHPLPGPATEDMSARLVAALCGGDAAATIRSGVADRLRLTVSVHPVSATTLRGFWLPFSGMYGIGTLRLGLERMVTVPGVPRPVPALVWHAERPVGGPWRTTERQIATLLDEMAAELVAAGPMHRCTT
jgi:hypothetical protein